MRLVTWNCCRGAYSTTGALLDSLAASLVVVQECAKPDVGSEKSLWFGENARQGIAVRASDPYTIQALPRAPDVPKFVIPI